MIRLIKRNFLIRSVIQDKFGGPEVLKIGNREISAEPDSNSIRVKVHFTALNRADLLQREGKYPNQKNILNLGLECSGHVTKVGSNVDNIAVGTAVMALLDGGGYSEYVDVPAALEIYGPRP